MGDLETQGRQSAWLWVEGQERRAAQRHWGEEDGVPGAGEGRRGVSRLDLESKPRGHQQQRHLKAPRCPIPAQPGPPGAPPPGRSQAAERSPGGPGVASLCPKVSRLGGAGEGTPHRHQRR